MIEAEEAKANEWKEKWAYRDPPPFEANPLPRTNRIGLYDKLVESKIREIEGRRSLINRVKDERRGTKPDPFEYLPPGMAEHEHENQMKRQIKEREDAKKFKEDFCFKPQINHFPDNFNWELYTIIYLAITRKGRTNLEKT